MPGGRDRPMLASAFFDLDQTNNLVVVHFATRQLTQAQALEVCAELVQRMRCHNASYFVWDMAGVEHIASACLGAMVGLLQEVEHVRGRVALANCRPPVAHLFKLTRLDSVITVYDDLDAAKAGIVRG
jgi:anti-sigma B factor antagonist